MSLFALSSSIVITAVDSDSAICTGIEVCIVGLGLVRAFLLYYYWAPTTLTHPICTKLFFYDNLSASLTCLDLPIPVQPPKMISLPMNFYV